MAESFNPRVRAGRDARQPQEPHRSRVSIHASARDATGRKERHPIGYLFQSTRPRGTRHLCLDAVHAVDAFQSTRPRGTRRQEGAASHRVLVSIHASARDATKASDEDEVMDQVSIHASARDATAGTGTLTLACLFQSTRPRGTRPSARKLQVTMACFNPRVRAGRDQRRLRNPRRGNVSIHASARDATASAASDWEWIAFQSTRPRGTRHYDEVIQPLIDVSIHASARDATAHFRLCRHGAPVSIHASARDATVTANGVPEYILVSIHASARDATRQRTVSAITGEFQSTRPRGTRPKHHIDCDREASFNPRVRAGRDVSKYERF